VESKIPYCRARGGSKRLLLVEPAVEQEAELKYLCLEEPEIEQEDEPKDCFL
jgi:hypothetical protein